MWVDAIKMRRAGSRLPTEELEAMVPQRGRLWVTVLRGWADDGERRPLTASLLGDRGTERIIWQLDRARVKVRDGQIMIIGFEDVGSSPKWPKLVRQVWWCDPVRAALDEVEAQAKNRFPPTAGRGRSRPAPPPPQRTQYLTGMVPAWVSEVAPGDLR